MLTWSALTRSFQRGKAHPQKGIENGLVQRPRDCSARIYDKASVLCDFGTGEKLRGRGGLYASHGRVVDSCLIDVCFGRSVVSLLSNLPFLFFFLLCIYFFLNLPSV